MGVAVSDLITIRRRRRGSQLVTSSSAMVRHSVLFSGNSCAHYQPSLPPLDLLAALQLPSVMLLSGSGGGSGFSPPPLPYFH